MHAQACAFHEHSGEGGIEKRAAIRCAQVKVSSGRASSTQITSRQVEHSSPRLITRGMRISPTMPPLFRLYLLDRVIDVTIAPTRKLVRVGHRFIAVKSSAFRNGESP